MEASLQEDLARQLKREIASTEKSVSFWQEQVRLQHRTALEGLVRNIAKSYAEQLQRLRNAQKVVDNA